MREQKLAVRLMQDYIEAHLNEQITLRQLSHVAGYSPYHASKLFKEITGFSPYYYIKSLRLSKAALSLRDDHEKVLDVALDFLFDSHEGFTRAFAKQFGVTPKKYQLSSPPIPLFLPYPVHVNETRGEKSMQTIFTQIMERPDRKMIIKRGRQATEYFSYCDEVGCEVWGVLSSVKEAVYEPMGLWLPQCMIKPGTSKYVQGVEVPMDYDKPLPEGYEFLELPATQVMIFQGEPFKGMAFESVIEAITNYNPEIVGYKYIEDEQPRFQLEPQEDRGYIEGRPVRKI